MYKIFHYWVCDSSKILWCSHLYYNYKSKFHNNRETYYIYCSYFILENNSISCYISNKTNQVWSNMAIHCNTFHGCLWKGCSSCVLIPLPKAQMQPLLLQKLLILFHFHWRYHFFQPLYFKWQLGSKLEIYLYIIIKLL